jgi:formylglycine-generating enzyme required for sulfatase activity
MLETFLSLGSGINTAIELYKNVTGLFKGDEKAQCLEQMNQHLGNISSHIERLSDKILYAPNMQVVSDVTKTRQQKVEDLRETRACLEPVQRALGDEILSSAMILTPSKMRNAMAANPWEVLDNICPLNRVRPHPNINMVPVLFEDSGVPYIGWQLRRTLPILFDCQFDELWTPSSGSEKLWTPSSSGEEFEFEVVTVNAKGKITQRRQHKATQQTEWFNGVSLERVYIPGGSFKMGSTKYDSEKPPHQVTIKPFYLGKYPVTQAQWQAVMGNNPSGFKGEKRPVEKVSWNQAVEFCQKLSAREGETYRLPSEAEWEYACRAGTTTPFYFGETITSDLVNYDGNYPYGSAPKGTYRKETTEVGQFPPNAFGLYDMHGNVWEWCADIFHDNYQGAPIDGSVWEKGGKGRVRRGGSWYDGADDCRTANRDWSDPVDRDGDVGFRVVWVAR